MSRGQRLIWVLNARRLFSIKSTIPQLEALISLLDQIPKLSCRRIYPLYYMGKAVELEEERITQQMFDSLSSRIRQYTDLGFGSLREPRTTETEWIDRLRNGYKVANEKYLRIILSENNLDELETRYCGEIIVSVRISPYRRLCLHGRRSSCERCD